MQYFSSIGPIVLPDWRTDIHAHTTSLSYISMDIKPTQTLFKFELPTTDLKGHMTEVHLFEVKLNPYKIYFLNNVDLEITLRIELKVKSKVTIEFLVENCFNNDLPFSRNSLPEEIRNGSVNPTQTLRKFESPSADLKGHSWPMTEVDFCKIARSFHCLCKKKGFFLKIPWNYLEITLKSS